jgi:hypothetical protein
MVEFVPEFLGTDTAMDHSARGSFIWTLDRPANGRLHASRLTFSLTRHIAEGIGISDAQQTGSQCHIILQVNYGTAQVKGRTITDCK